MGIIIWLIISAIIITPYVVFHFHRKSDDTASINWGLDWISLLATSFAGVAFGRLLSQTTELNTPWMLLFVAPFLVIGILMFTLPRKAMEGIVRPGISVDERVSMISSKSARNALLVNYLVLLVLVIIDRDSLDSNLLVILPGSGLVVFYASYLLYSYARS